MTRNKLHPKYPGIDEWHGMPLSDHRNVYPHGDLCHLKRKDPELYMDITNVARRLDDKASAEITGFVSIARDRAHSYNGVEAPLIPTTTRTSSLSAEINRELSLEKGFGRVEVEYVNGLSS